MFGQHGKEKEVLLNALTELMNIAGDQDNRPAAELLAETKERLQKEKFTLVVLGEFKRGKSTLVNALLGEQLLPAAIVPLTAIPTVIHFQERQSARVVFLDGREKEIDPAEIPLYVTEKENPANKKLVKEVLVGYANPFLKQGVILVDTPGVGSVYEHNTGAAYAYLPRSDAAIFTLSVDSPLSKMEIEYLKDVRQFVRKIFFVVNKADLAAGNEIREVMDFSRRVLENIFAGREIQLLAVSARKALEGKLENNRQKLLASGILELEEKVGDFIERNKGRLLREIAASRGLRIAGELELALKLWRRAAEETEAGLREKIARFNAELARLEQEREDSIYLLYREVDRLRKVVEENMADFRRQKEGEIIRRLDEFAGGARAGSPREYALALKQKIQEIVRSTVEEKRMAERSALEEKFKGVASRFFARIEEIIDRLMDASAEIFQVSVEKTASKNYVLGKRSFSFHFADHPTFVPPLEDLPAMGILPGGLFRQYLLNRSRKMLAELFERNCGRVRENLAEGLKEEARDVAGELRLRADAVARGLQAALKKAEEQHRSSLPEREAAVRKQEALAGRLREIKSILKKFAE
ncbi:MAG: dynamin family protein [Desulfotomaculales bacterium]